MAEMITARVNLIHTSVIAPNATTTVTRVAIGTLITMMTSGDIQCPIAVIGRLSRLR